MPRTVLGVDGGLNTLQEPYAIQDNQTPDCLNVSFHKPGSMQSREGYHRANDAAVGTGAIEGIHQYVKEDGTKTLLIKRGTELRAFTLDGNDKATVSGSTVQTGLTSGFKPWFFTFDNNMIMLDKGANYVYDGTNITELGRDAPTTTGLTVTSANNVGGAMVAAEVYSYKFAFYSTSLDMESTVSSNVDVTIAGGDNSTDISFPAAVTNELDTVWDKIRVFRTTTGGATYYRHSDQTADFSDLTISGGVTSNAVLSDTGFFKLPGARAGVEYLGRLWAVVESEPTNIYYSEAGEAHQFKSSSVLRVGRQDGDHIVGCFVTHGRMYILKQNALYTLVGTDPNSFYFQEIEGGMGGEAGRAVAIAQGMAYVYNSAHGIYRFIGASVQRIGRKIWDDIRGLDRSAAEDEFVAAYEPRTESIWFSVRRSGESVNDRVYVYFTRTQSWGLYDIRANCFAHIHRADGTRALMFGDENGYLNWVDGSKNDGDRTGTLTGTAASGSNTTTIVDSGFVTANDGLDQIPIKVLYSDNTVEESIITSNTATNLTLSPALSTDPTGATYFVGGIHLQYKTKVSDLGDPFSSKAVPTVDVAFMDQDTTEDLRIRLNRENNQTGTYTTVSVDATTDNGFEFGPQAYARRVQVQMFHVDSSEPVIVQALSIMSRPAEQRQ